MTVPPELFVERRDKFCLPCPWWRGACLKGHVLGSAEGCPIHRFAPWNGAAYAPDPPVKTNPAELVPGCCQPEAEPPELSWSRVLAQFAVSLAAWIKEGMPVVDAREHGARHDQCKACPHFKNFYCRKCRCVAYLKTKLATECCPDDPPRWTASATARAGPRP
jgi:hypothetical protein